MFCGADGGGITGFKLFFSITFIGAGFAGGGGGAVGFGALLFSAIGLFLDRTEWKCDYVFTGRCVASLYVMLAGAGGGGGGGMGNGMSVREGILGGGGCCGGGGGVDGAEVCGVGYWDIQTPRILRTHAERITTPNAVSATVRQYMQRLKERVLRFATRKFTVTASERRWHNDSPRDLMTASSTCSSV